MYRKAFEEALRVLKAIPPYAPFDMESWVGRSFAEDGDTYEPGGYLLRLPCGTAACAVGYMASDPWFQKNGLRLKLLPYGHSLGAVPTYKKEINIDACASFFDIDYHAAEALFTSEGYDEEEYKIGGITPGMVAEKIEQLLETNNVYSAEYGCLVSA